MENLTSKDLKVLEKEYSNKIRKIQADKTRDLKNISLNTLQENVNKYNRVLDVSFDYPSTQGDASGELVGKDIDILLELMTIDFLNVNPLEMSVQNISLYKTILKRVFTMTVSSHTLKDYKKIVDIYKNPQARTDISTLSLTEEGHMITDTFSSIYREIKRLDFNYPDDILIEEFKYITCGAKNALKRYGIFTLKDLQGFMEFNKLTSIRKLGKVGITGILKSLELIEANKLEENKQKDILCNHCNANLTKEGLRIDYNAKVSSSYIYNIKTGKFELEVQEISDNSNVNIYCPKCGKTLSEDIQNSIDF